MRTRKAATKAARRGANGKANLKAKTTMNGKAAKAAANGALNGHATSKNGLKKQETKDAIKSGEWSVTWLDVKDIAPNPYQPRVEFDPEEMQDLTASVKAHGVHQPVTVRTIKPQETAESSDESKAEEKAANLPTHRYHLVVGERRLRACKTAGRKRIPAIVRDDLSDAEVAELALVENVQRARLNPIEAARGYKRLMLDFRMKEERIAKRMGLSVQTIKDAIRLLQLPESVQSLIAKKRLTPAHGQTLLRLAAFPTVCEMVAQHAADNSVTAKSLESNPLPNASALEKKGWITALDWRTKFDWKNVCGSCPHGAYISAQFSAYCLKPSEAKAKNEAAIELQKQEAVRVMEEARQNESQTVESDALPRVQYRNLTHGEPAGCSEACSCRRQMRDPSDETRTVPICIDPARYDELRQTERQENERQRAAHYEELWNRAMHRCDDEIAGGNQSKPVALLLRSLLMDSRSHYAAPQDYWEKGALLAKELGIDLDWNKLQDTETSTFEELQLIVQVEPRKLLLLGVGLLLMQDARAAARFHESAPLLAFILDEPQEAQGEFEGMEESPDDREGFVSTDDLPTDCADKESESFADEDDALAAAHEAETNMLEDEREAAALSV